MGNREEVVFPGSSSDSVLQVASEYEDLGLSLKGRISISPLLPRQLEGHL